MRWAVRRLWRLFSREHLLKFNWSEKNVSWSVNGNRYSPVGCEKFTCIKQITLKTDINLTLSLTQKKMFEVKSKVYADRKTETACKIHFQCARKKHWESKIQPQNEKNCYNSTQQYNRSIPCADFQITALDFHFLLLQTSRGFDCVMQQQ